MQAVAIALRDSVNEAVAQPEKQALEVKVGELVGEGVKEDDRVSETEGVVD